MEHLQLQLQLRHSMYQHHLFNPLHRLFHTSSTYSFNSHKYFSKCCFGRGSYKANLLHIKHTLYHPFSSFQRILAGRREWVLHHGSLCEHHTHDSFQRILASQCEWVWHHSSPWKHRTCDNSMSLVISLPNQTSAFCNGTKTLLTRIRIDRNVGYGILDLANAPLRLFRGLAARQQAQPAAQPPPQARDPPQPGPPEDLGRRRNRVAHRYPMEDHRRPPPAQRNSLD